MWMAFFYVDDGVAQVMHLQLRVLEKTEVEKRLAKLEGLFQESIGQH
jgi:hypothetical protein